MEGIKWRSYIMPFVAFVAGSFLMPKMEWIPNTFRIWIFALALGLLVVRLLLSALPQRIIRENLQFSPFWTNITIAFIGLMFSVGSGLTITHFDWQHENTVELDNTAKDLLGEITVFVADRAILHPRPTAQWKSTDEWYQKSVEYSMETDNLFTHRFSQRISDLAFKLRRANIITQAELESLNWSNNPRFPNIDFLFGFLRDYCSRINK